MNWIMRWNQLDHIKIFDAFIILFLTSGLQLFKENQKKQRMKDGAIMQFKNL